MPQLDVVGFYPQWVWFLASFGTLYVTLVKGVLPKLSRALKYRALRREAGDARIAGFPAPQGVGAAGEVRRCAHFLARCVQEGRTWEMGAWRALQAGALAPAQGAYLAWHLEARLARHWRQRMHPWCALEVSPPAGEAWTARLMEVLETE